MTRRPATRLVALIGPLEADRQSTHTANHPLETTKMLPVADVVLLVSDDDTSAMLFRYTVVGEAGGDTFHLSIADAREQAAEEYGDALLEWEEVPEAIDDAHRFAVRYASDRLNDRGGWGKF